MSTFMSRCSTSGRRSDDTMDDDTDDKDDTKRKSRNLSEKKRRDQFNLLINELSSMVSTNSRKMDKSTVLKSTISFLRNHNDIAVRSRVHEIQEEWKPAFLSNEEFAHLILEALDGFIMVFSSSGRILYASQSITSLLGHLPSDLLNMTIYDVIYDEDQSQLFNMFLNPVTNVLYENNKDNQISFVCHCKRGSLDFSEEVSYELVQFVGYFRADMESLQLHDNGSSNRYSGFSGEADTRLVFVGTGRLQTPQLIREMSITDSTKSEFTSRHSLEWKFLFLDHRASQIIGYLPFEVLGTSGYDYYHVDDLDKVITCHEALMQKGEGTSCYYRFLTKGQQWIWLQTRFYITYHQWNSKPEFVVCTHKVISHINVIKQLRKDPSSSGEQSQDSEFNREPVPRYSSPWPSNRSPGNKSSHYELKRYHSRGGESDTSLSAESIPSRHSQNMRSRSVSSSAAKMTVPTSKAPVITEFIEPPVTFSVAAIPLQPLAFPAPTTVVSTIPTPEVSTSAAKMTAPTSKAAVITEFIEPPVTFSVAAIPLQPLAFPAPTTVVPTIPTPEVSTSAAKRTAPTSKAPVITEFIEPPVTFSVAAIPLQPLAFPAPTTVVSTIPTPEVSTSAAKMTAPTSKAPVITEFIEPPVTFSVAAIPLQPLAFPAPTTVVSTIPTPEVSTSAAKMTAPTSKAPVITEFIEPPVTFSVAAIPLQPLAFPAPTTVISTIPTPEVAIRQPLAMSSTQTQIQDQLQKKHEQLQQLIVQQQEELRRVSEQLLMARYGLLSPILNVGQVTMPYTVAPAPAPTLTMAATPSTEIFVPAHSTHRPHIMIDPHQMNYQQGTPQDVMPFQYPSQSAQLLFSQSLESPNSTQNSQ